MQVYDIIAAAATAAAGRTRAREIKFFIAGAFFEWNFRFGISSAVDRD